MGISQIGVAAATSSPTNAARPVFTLANTYDLSGSISTYEGASDSTDMFYDRTNQKICFPIDNTTTTNAFAVWTPGTTTVTKYNLPVSLQNGTYRFIVGGDDNIWYSPGLEGGNYSLYRSTNGGSSWTTPIGASTKYEIMPVSKGLVAMVNGTDVVPIIYFNGHPFGTGIFYNSTNNTTYSVNTDAYVTTYHGTSTKIRISEIKKGDDTGIILGYKGHNGFTHDGGNLSGGTAYNVSVKGYHFRTANGIGAAAYVDETWNSTYESRAEVSFSGRTTCIEGKWLVIMGGLYGNSLYDLVSKKTIGDIPEIETRWNTRVVYLSSTKKAYVYNKYNYKMYEYDVTFL